MRAKIVFSLLSLAVAGAVAQTPAPDDASREEALRRALRQSIEHGTNVTIPAPAAAAETKLADQQAVDSPFQRVPREPIPAPEPSLAVPVPEPAVIPEPAPVLAPAAPPVATPARSLVTPAAPPAADAASEIVPGRMIWFQSATIDQVLDFYSEMVGRTVLRPATLPAPAITLKSQSDLTKREAVQALDTVLAMNGITMIPVGEKFVKAVPFSQAQQEAAPFTSLDADELPEAAQYVTHIVQLKFARPSELIPVLTPFAKLPNSAHAIDSSQILVLRDYAENVKRMLELIKEVDVVVPSEFLSEVIPIKYALAPEIANALNSLGSGTGGTTVGRTTRSPSATTGRAQTTNPGLPGTPPQAATTPGAPGAPSATSSFTDRLRSIVQRASSSGEIQILGETKIIADERTNSLLIFATRQDMATIKDIVAKLDVVLAQVLIEAIIMEVSLDDGQNVGFSYLQRSPTKAGDFTGVGAIKNTPNFLNFGNFSGTNVSGSLGSGFSYLGRFGDEFEATLTAIANDSRINVLSRPRIQTSHAVPATLFIGNTVPFVTGTITDITGGSRSQFQNQRVGITLDVLPLINPDGLVVMDISQIIQQLGNPTIIDGNPVPTTTERNATAKVAVKDRDTIILGGFISSTKSNSKSGVPYLKDIPILGNLFRSTVDSNQRVELVVLMRPTVLPTPEAAAIHAQMDRESMPGISVAEQEYLKEEAKRLKEAEAQKKKIGRQ